MYRLTITWYGTKPITRLNALFEQEENGKTEGLANTAMWGPENAAFESLSHGQILVDLEGSVPELIQRLLLRMDGDPLF